MDSEGLSRRKPVASVVQDGKDTLRPSNGTEEVKVSKTDEGIRMGLFGAYFLACITGIHTTQWLGAWLYLVSKDWFYAWMAVTKQHFGLLIITLTHWWCPTVVRVSGDESVRGQLKKGKDGCLECDFPERMVMVANHQIYTEWVYLWWIAYTSRMHGHIYIILKESLKFLPIIGPGMMFYGFVFLSRHWETDRPRFAHRLQKLKGRHSGPLSGKNDLDPMWLLIFPEGTNLSKNGRTKSSAWAAKQSIPDLRHALLPRSTGLQFCLQELKGTVDYIYDCTIAYEGVPEGVYGQDIFTLKSTYFQGHPPKSVNMHWRRFATKDLPIDNSEQFSEWVLKRWREKDELLEHYHSTGRFPADEGEGTVMSGDGVKHVRGAGYIETEIRTNVLAEFAQIFVPLALVALAIHWMRRILQIVLSF